MPLRRSAATAAASAASAASPATHLAAVLLLPLSVAALLGHAAVAVPAPQADPLRHGPFQSYRQEPADLEDANQRLEALEEGPALQRGLDLLGGGSSVRLQRPTRGGLDSLSGVTFGGQKRLDSLSGISFGTQKRNFDEIDRAGFNGFVKKNFDEIDRTGFDSFVKRNFDEIDRVGFANFVKRNAPALLARYYDRQNR